MGVACHAAWCSTLLMCEQRENKKQLFFCWYRMQAVLEAPCLVHGGGPQVS
jgi:hypothetical protein